MFQLFNISVKKITLFLTLFIITLFLGYILKNGIGILFVLIFFYLLVTNKIDELILFTISWLFISNFYIGQGYVSNEFISKYLMKGQFYVVILFVIYRKKTWYKNGVEQKLFKWAIIFLTIIFLSDILHFSIKLNFVNQGYFIFLFLIILYLPSKETFETNLINLLIAIGALQVIISFLQVKQFIAPAMKTMKDSKTSSFLWTAGLDDAASGTFGAGASNVTSWLETILFLAFFSYGVLKKSTFIVICSFLFLVQYSFVDSKTAIGATIIAFIILAYKIKMLNLLKIKNLIYVSIIIAFVFVSKMMITSYYETTSVISADDAGAMVASSSEIVLTNILDWGKIAGFKFISEDYFNHNPTYLLIGYGRGNYEYNNNRGRIESMDSPLMQINNITRSRSSLIYAYGNLGIPGLFITLWLFVILLKDIRTRKFNTLIGTSFKYSGPAILLGSLLFMFLYAGHSINDLAFLLFFILFALVLRIENKFNQIQKT